MKKTVVSIIAILVFFIFAYVMYVDVFHESDIEKRYFPEQRFARLVENCADDKPNECNRLGMAYERGHGVKKSIPNAFKAYKRACELKNYYACSNQGLMTLRGIEGQKADPHAALELFRIGCLERRHSPACVQASKIYAHSSDDTLFDLKKAYKALDAGCRLDNVEACGLRGTYVLQDRFSGQSRDRAQAAKDVDAYCNQYNGDVCFFLIERSKRKKKTQLLGYLERHFLSVCQATTSHDSSYCRFVEAMLKRYGSPTIAKSLSESNTLFEGVCSVEEPVACYFRALNAEEQNDEPASITYKRKSCEYDRFLGCTE